ncbi:MAG: PIG-L deacetylase family protein [Candidatus Hydrogenedentota bacterium]
MTKCSRDSAGVEGSMGAREHKRWSRAMAMLLGLAILGAAAMPAAAGPTAGPAPDPEWRPQAADVPDDGRVRVIVFGAHPDDAEIRAGGAGVRWANQGHHVKFVSLTNGDIGHWGMAGGPLAQRRTAEVEEAAGILGIDEVEVLDIHDGELMPTLENRKTVVRLIREWMADIVVVHRPNDYHPDHRNAGLLVRDAAFMVTVPFFCPDAPYLETNPVFLYGLDRFERPYPFQPDIVVNIDPVIDTKLDALAVMESQFVEGGAVGDPYIPETEAEWEEAREDMRERFSQRFSSDADQHRDRIIEIYGEETGGSIQHIEAFEIAEHGRQPDEDELRRLFPFEDMWEE